MMKDEYDFSKGVRGKFYRENAIHVDLNLADNRCHAEFISASHLSKPLKQVQGDAGVKFKFLKKQKQK